MKTLFMASGAFALPTLEWLLDSGHEIVGVVTQPARSSGRGRRVTRTPVGAVAEDRGLEVMSPEDVNDPEVVGKIRATGANLGVVIAFGQKLGAELIGSLPHGFVNLHASLLPRYRGAAPINWAIIRGDATSGVTVFRINERMDAGVILTTRATPIGDIETASELHDRLAVIGVDAVRECVEIFEGSSDPTGVVQNAAEVTKAPKLSKADGILDFSGSAAELACRIRGLWSWPGTSARFEAADGRWEQVQIARAKSHASGAAGGRRNSGEIDEDRFVTCGTGRLEILEIKPSSGQLMTWPEYCNGRHVTAGDRLTQPDSSPPTHWSRPQG